jgi:Tfp pilus assembly protein PilF
MDGDSAAQAQAHAELAYALDQAGATSEAEQHYRSALALAPFSATLHMNLGALLAQQKRHAEAEACYAAALQLEPESSEVWSNLGALYLNLKNEDAADACLRKAMVLDPGNAKARFNLAYLQLRLENWHEGWALFEARDWYQAMAQRLDFPRWQGEPLVGRSLLVCFEAGHGDVIQFCRYIPLLKKHGAQRITLLCQPALTRLMRGLDDLDAVVGLDQPLPPEHFDFWLPLMSAPHHLATRLHSVPAQLPYLQPEPALQDHWTHRIPASQALRVGLVWKGNPKFENDADRSLPHLQTLAPLWQVPGVQFFSLQKGAGEDDIVPGSPQLPLVALGRELHDFADAAAVVSALELVITVDTAMAHLAGALGKPCWLLLPWYMTDWRWGAEGASSVWYPQVMRLFRQASDGDWAPVIAEVRLALLERTAPQRERLA